MNKKRLINVLFVLCAFPILISCGRSVKKIKNTQEGTYIAQYQMEVIGEKKFLLDTETPPRTPYIQLLKDQNGNRVCTFLNTYKNSIYYYDYTTTDYIKRTVFPKEGPNGISRPSGYHIKNADSVYIYNMPMTEICLSTDQGKIKQKISLRGNGDALEWPLYYPQYYFSTVCPIIETTDQLILTGISFVSLKVDQIDKFKFTAYLNFKTNQIEFKHTYPKELYGDGANWEGGLQTQVFPTLSPSGELFHSYPVSHDVYRTNSAEKIYAGSYTVGTIESIDASVENTPSKLIFENFLEQDMYGALLYDPYRHLYYRFVLRKLSETSVKSKKEEKPVCIIVFDENFNYLGETEIGTGKEWNWNNSFVTEEGLNIEYVDYTDMEEDYMNFKIFQAKKL